MANPETAPVQAAVDRARASARNKLRRAAAELSRLQTDRYIRSRLMPDNEKRRLNLAAQGPADAAPKIEEQPVQPCSTATTCARLLDHLDAFEKFFTRGTPKINSPIAKQSQFSEAEPPGTTPAPPKPEGQNARPRDALSSGAAPREKAA